MKIIEIIIRKLLISFGIASIFTYFYNVNSSTLEEISWITWIVTAGLFVFSWRFQKELKEIFIKEVDEDTSLWGTFEKRFPKVAFLAWESIVTIGAIHIAYLAFDLLHIIEVDGQRTKLFFWAFCMNLIFRIVDQHTYRKK